ncbi:MAG TPA: TetR family transcriptional regulator [Gemmatimonadaceae bacterium]|jgi:AcrR family transcriptional regulator
MPRKAARAERRTDALSRERIIDAAIEILDAQGETALTFRALATHLSTGSGAIYWHLADKNELLAAAADSVVVTAITSVSNRAQPKNAIRNIALALFDAIDERPWVGAQLAREPWRPAMRDIVEAIGQQLQALGVARRALFNTASALVDYIVGAAGQNAAHARLLPPGTDRAAFLANVADEWTSVDPAKYPFVHQMAAQMRDHDDRKQFMAGIDLMIAGIERDL